jgi:hypothetical protein
VQPPNFPHARITLLIAAVLVLGVALVSTAASVWTAARSPGPTSVATAKPTPSARPTLPAADAPGEDFARLPRYPGSVRSAHAVDRDAQFRLATAEYLVVATIDDVRTFYQGVIVEYGWERADIGFHRGEWTYVLVDGATEALIEIEELNGLIEIDLQVSEPVADPAPAATPVPPATPVPTARPPAPPPTDDDDDDDSGGDEGEGDDDD